MKSIISVILIAVLSFALGLYLPWWSIAIAAFIVTALIHQRPGPAFLTGFIAIFLTWALLAFVIDMRNQHILSKKLAQLLPLGGSSFLLILITGLVGGLVGGLSAMSGSYLKKIR